MHNKPRLIPVYALERRRQGIKISEILSDNAVAELNKGTHRMVNVLSFI